MRIIVVEDENIARKWLKKSIEAIDFNYHVVGEFSNGQLALEYCSKNDVDVIFTDIRMAIMDGLEFLEKMNSLEMNPYKIILSAYDEFHYARQAMKLGVHEFLLKPEVTRKEIGHILEAAQEYLQNQRNKHKLAYQDKMNAQEKYLQYLIKKEGILNENEIKQGFATNNILLKEDSLAVCTFYVRTSAESGHIKEVIQLFLDTEQVCGYCAEINDHEFAFLYSPDITQTREDISTKLYRLLLTHFGTEIYAGVSKTGKGFTELKNLYRQASSAKDNRFFFCIPGLQLYSNMQIYTETGELAYRKAIIQTKELLSHNTVNMAEKNLKDFLNHIKQNTDLYPAYIRALCVEILSLYIQHIKGYSLSIQDEKAVQEIELAFSSHFSTYSRLEEFMISAHRKLAKILGEKAKIRQYSAPIQKITEYVTVHYAEKISLERIAKQVHLNRTYISSIFKKETGEKFSDYLQKVRLDASKELLKSDSEMTLQSIAEQTGFCDAAHLSRVFKDHYGVSPIEFRRTEQNFIQKN